MTQKKRPPDIQTTLAPHVRKLQQSADSIFGLGLYLPRVIESWMGVAVLLLIYFFTSSRDLYWFDSAELALAGLQNGLSHPPGQPLHTMALHAGAAGGNGQNAALLWMNFVSNLAGALCVLPVCSIVFTLLRRNNGEGPESGWLLLKATMIAVLAVGAGMIPQLWESSTRVEVYSLAAFLGLMQIALLLPVLSGDARKPGRIFWTVQGLLLGLLFSTNPIMAAANMAATLLAAIVSLKERKLRLTAALLMAAPGFAVGILPYIHLFYVAGLEDRFVWGAPATAGAFMFYIRGGDYAHNLGASPGGVFTHLGVFGIWNMKQGILALVLAGMAGWMLALLRHEGALVLIVGCFCIPLLFVCKNDPYLPDIPDFFNYLSAGYWLLAAGTVALMLTVLQRLRSGLLRRILMPAAAGLWLVSMALLPPTLWSRSRMENKVPRRLAEASLAEAPEGAIVLVSSDHLFFPLFYLTEGEGERPDVVLINAGFASSSWYWKMLYNRHPELEPFDIRASDRYERIGNFLAANPGREVLAENLFLGNLARRLLCLGGWLVETGDLCMDARAGERQAKREQARQRLVSWVEQFGGPGTVDERVLATVGLSWGHDERSMGLNADAVTSYLAGAGMQWEGLTDNVRAGQMPFVASFTGPAMLSSAAYNLLYASELMQFFDRERAADLAARAAALSR
ncbi:MAG: DUF2723 domain-containing protein [Pseudomonadota bacterium]